MTNYKKLFKEALTPNYLKEEDRATTVDKMLSGEYEDEDYKDSKRYDDVRAELEDEVNEDKLPDGFHSKEDLDQFLKDNPFDSERYKKLSIAQKQDILSYLNRDTEKEFERRMAMLEENEKFDHIARAEYGKSFAMLSDEENEEMLKAIAKYSKPAFKTDFQQRRQGDLDDEYDGMTDYQRGRMDEDMNDPVLMKARAAKMADEKEMARQAALDKKYGPTFMDKLDAELDLKAELQDLKDEKEQLMIDMEQEAEPEGGEIADEYGSRLNDIDARMAEIKPELEDLRMYESINENREAIKETFRFIKENNPEFTNEEIKAELKEIKKLGNQLNEELCAKGKAYRKRRMAAGEKSSAYLSGRAVKVCKGQMSGKKKKK